MSKNSIKKYLYFAWRTKNALAESNSPPQELEEGPHIGPYLLVSGYNWFELRTTKQAKKPKESDFSNVLEIYQELTVLLSVP